MYIYIKWLLTTQYKNLYFAVDNNKLTNNDEILRINLSSLIPILVKVYQEIFSYIYIYMISSKERRWWMPDQRFVRGKKTTKRSIIDFVRSIFVHEHFPFSRYPTLSFIPKWEGGISRFLANLAGWCKMKMKGAGYAEKSKAMQTPFFFFTFSSVGRSNRALRIPQLLHYRWILFVWM